MRTAYVLGMALVFAACESPATLEEYREPEIIGPTEVVGEWVGPVLVCTIPLTIKVTRPTTVIEGLLELIFPAPRDGTTAAKSELELTQEQLREFWGERIRDEKTVEFRIEPIIANSSSSGTFEFGYEDEETSSRLVHSYDCLEP